jgi:dUTP pyrophosphatase
MRRSMCNKTNCGGDYVDDGEPERYGSSRMRQPAKCDRCGDSITIDMEDPKAKPYIPPPTPRRANGINVVTLDEVCKLKKAHEDDAGYDLRARETLVLRPMGRGKVLCGVRIELPRNVEAQIRPRSSMLIKWGLHVAFGTVDAGYRGELGVGVVNLGDQTLTIEKGDAVAQLVVARLEDFWFHEVKELSDSSRGEKGWGSSG